MFHIYKISRYFWLIVNGKETFEDSKFFYNRPPLLTSNDSIFTVLYEGWLLNAYPDERL